MAKLGYLPKSKRRHAFEAISADRQGKRYYSPLHLHPEQRDTMLP